ncbi:MAG: GNAT family N-acetyltransferase [Oscillospiraceae bacterium]|nr:GNAT family N-acetyltransferase [Oscillospiraceae bacterium]
MIIRKCELSDITSVYELIKNELGYPNITESDVRKRFELMISLENYDVMVAEIDRKVCGFISTVKEISLEVDGEFLRVIGLAVRFEYQKSGIGSALLRTVEDIADEHNYGVITLSSNFKRTEAHKFYEKQGYSKTSYTFKKFM